MKGRFLLILTLFFSSCIQQLNQNLEKSNELVQQNMEALTQSRLAIEANTQEIHHSTQTMQQFQIVMPILFGLIVLLMMWLGYKWIKKYLHR